MENGAVSAEVLVALAGYFFARQATLQEAMTAVRDSWNFVEARIPGVFSPHDSYEVYQATFGKVLLRVRRYPNNTEELINLTVVPTENLQAEETIKLVITDIERRQMSVELSTKWPDFNKSSAIRLQYGTRILEILISQGLLRMITLWETTRLTGSNVL